MGPPPPPLVSEGHAEVLIDSPAASGGEVQDEGLDGSANSDTEHAPKKLKTQ